MNESQPEQSATDSLHAQPPVWIGALGLAILAFLCFSPALGFDFINYDDPEYFANNPHVLGGLTKANIAWAFQTETLASRYPVTWLSFMLDADLFGKRPLGPHLTNLLLHTANVVLVFLLLRSWTGKFWRSLCVAALFAVHPLRVEPVVWISERKGLLSAFFSLLVLWTYGRAVAAVRARSAPAARIPAVWTNHHFWFAVFGCLLAIMAKPIAVTLPCVLLLLDFWPMRRIELTHRALAVRQAAALVFEKFPFFLLTLLGCAITLVTHQHSGAVVAMTEHSVGARVSTAIIGYATYLAKAVWPATLAIPYPMPKQWPAEQVIMSAVALTLIVAVVLWLGRKRPLLWFGWLWYLGLLVPVIGLVRWGDQAMADRFTYLPLLGVLLAVVWSGGEILARFGVSGRMQVLAGLLIVVAYASRTLDQLRYWRNSEVLFRHSLAVTQDNYVALSNLGSALDDAGKSDEAMPLFLEALRIGPHDPDAYYNMGTALMKLGRLEEAIESFRAAIRFKPGFTRAHSNLGASLLRLGRFDEAKLSFVEAVRLEPDDAETLFNLATVLINQAEIPAAITNLVLAVKLKPDYAQAHANLGVALMRLGNAELGLKHFAEAARLDPKNPEAHFNLGLAWLDQNRPADAERSFRCALELQPHNPKILLRLGMALVRQKQWSQATVSYREALQVSTDQIEVISELAWLLATCPEAGFRNATEALALAQRAAELTQQGHPGVLLSLAAAQAEAGRFEEATASALQAQSLARSAGQVALGERAERMLKAFAQRVPYRE